jgi:hypothetical protein
MEVACALSLILAQVNTVASGFHGRVFTFDDKPELVTVIEEADEGTEEVPILLDIGKMVAKTRAITWGGSTDLMKTFDLFLENAITNEIPPDVLVKQQLVFFSDMEFDAIDPRFSQGEDREKDCPCIWQSLTEEIAAKFEAKGYLEIPRLVFWNLRSSASIPVKQNCAGVVLLSGFSAGLLNSFLAGNLSEFTPEAQLSAVINQDIYKLLKVAEGE